MNLELKICNECAEIPSATKMCGRCDQEFCGHNASTTDVRMCSTCLADFHVTESIVTKTTEILNSKNEVISKRVQHAMQYTLEGTDWFFTARKILSMSDQDLENTIEYHRAVASIMLNERTSRQMERAHKLAQIKVSFSSTRETQFEKEERERKAQEKADEKEAKKASGGNTKRTSTKSKNSMSVEELLAALTKLQKAGLSVDQIIGMAGKK